MSSYLLKTKTLRSAPSDAFKECPMCDAKELLRFDGEAFCNYCDWHSISATLDAIGLRAFQLGDGLTIGEATSVEQLIKNGCDALSA